MRPTESFFLLLLLHQAVLGGSDVLCAAFVSLTIQATSPRRRAFCACASVCVAAVRNCSSDPLPFKNPEHNKCELFHPEQNKTEKKGKPVITMQNKLFFDLYIVHEYPVEENVLTKHIYLPIKYTVCIFLLLCVNRRASELHSMILTSIIINGSSTPQERLVSSAGRLRGERMSWSGRRRVKCSQPRQMEPLHGCRGQRGKMSEALMKV